MTGNNVDVQLLEAQADTVFFASEMFREMGMERIAELLYGAGNQLYDTWLNLAMEGSVAYFSGKRTDESVDISDVARRMSLVSKVYNQACEGSR